MMPTHGMHVRLRCVAAKQFTDPRYAKVLQESLDGFDTVIAC
ncbi:hypothetical protein [Duganella sp.]